jgi:tRNA (guanine10-N2)-methyltransferase
MLCANITRVQAGALVVDPFVGTASLLVAASHFGATCFGSDIDIRVLKGNHRCTSLLAWLVSSV